MLLCQRFGMDRQLAPLLSEVPVHGARLRFIRQDRCTFAFGGFGKAGFGAGHALPNRNAPNFEATAFVAFERVKIALRAVRLDAEKEHFVIAVRAQQQGGRRVLWILVGEIYDGHADAPFLLQAGARTVSQPPTPGAVPRPVMGVMMRAFPTDSKPYFTYPRWDGAAAYLSE